MESLVGHLLIAIPELPDSNFFRSVVLMLQHSEEGASGVILNRPSNISVAKVWDEISSKVCVCNSEQTINVGGPVEGPLIALHASLSLGEVQILPGLFMSISRDNLNQLVNQETHEFRIYSGYAGWAPQQLESEIKQGGWLTMKAEYEHVFNSPDELWKNVCAEVGHEIMLPHFGIKSLPSDPSIN
jgi:putative transcriptional regulator